MGGYRQFPFWKEFTANLTTARIFCLLILFHRKQSLRTNRVLEQALCCMQGNGDVEKVNAGALAALPAENETQLCQEFCGSDCVKTPYCLWQRDGKTGNGAAGFTRAYFPSLSSGYGFYQGSHPHNTDCTFQVVRRKCQRSPVFTQSDTVKLQGECFRGGRYWRTSRKTRQKPFALKGRTKHGGR
jgi:hypothetical protein